MPADKRPARDRRCDVYHPTWGRLDIEVNAALQRGERQVTDSLELLPYA
jgi:hypothetical protein